MEEPWEVWNIAEGAFTEFSNAKPVTISKVPSNQVVQASWTPPLAGHVKICCDAAFDVQTGKSAVAAIGRDSIGSIIAGHSACLYAPSASAAEASGIRLGVEMDVSFGLDHIIFESDYKQVVLRLNSGVLSAWESAAIEEDILSLASSFLSVSFSFIPRTCNRVADWVTKNVLNGSCPRDWVANPPQGLLSLL
ncbi:hypothetical protein GQ457_10G011310 [Hibiscus cannabinus]